MVSIFEPHTDIIKKGQREILYGHKILFSGGKSNLILNCTIKRGNPAFGRDRWTWSGFESFESYVQLAVPAFDLQTLARHLLA